MKHSIKIFLLLGLFSTCSHAWEKTYTFRFNNSINSIVLNYDIDDLKACREAVWIWHKNEGTLSSKKDDNYKKYIKYPPCNEIVEEVINKLNYLYQNDLVVVESQKDYVDLFIAFVNGIPYQYDNLAWKKDYIQTPFETVYFNQGDCEDHALLLASMFRLLCYDSIFINLPTHLAVGIEESAIPESESGGMHYYKSNGKNYYYCEATRGKYCPTCENFEVGYMPEGEQGKNATLEHLSAVCE